MSAEIDHQLLQCAVVQHVIGDDAVLEFLDDDPVRRRPHPLAAVVPVKGAALTPDELREFLAERVPKWQLPERWTFIEEVPKTSVGKFDKKALRTMADSLV